MNNVIKNVAIRTDGELYCAVVGSVRSGKSMFIRKFMQNRVIPFVQDENEKQRIIDELPQSAEGKTIMTVEPKFIPSKSANVVIENELNISVRLVDCVGYVIPTALGYMNEDESPRLVRTPWFNEDIPFMDAATIGTKKVIENHSHIAVVLTSDGSFGEFSRDDYKQIEESLIQDVQSTNKPFVIVLNTTLPNDEKTSMLVQELKEKYNVSVVAVDVKNMTENDVNEILRLSLDEFQIDSLNINVPDWLDYLDSNHPSIQEFTDVMNDVTLKQNKFKDVEMIRTKLSSCPICNEVVINNLDCGTGIVEINVSFVDNLYEEIISSLLGKEVLNDKGSFLKFIIESIENNTEYSQYKKALEEVKTKGYGISTPLISDMQLDTPEVTKVNGRYGIKLRAIAPSIHMVKVDVESIFEPIIGSFEQSKQIIDKLSSDFESNPEGIWNTELFGRKLSEVVNDGIRTKLYLFPEDVEYKFKESLEKMVNKGKGGILAFVL